MACMKSTGISSFVLFLRYQVRLIWHVNLWLAPVIALLMGLAMYLPEGPHQERLFWIMKWSESFFPLLGIAVCANLFSQEMENQTAELWLAKSISRTKLVLARVSAVCIYTVLVIAIPLIIKYFSYVRFSWAEMMLVVLPPTLYLGLLGMLVGILFKNSAIAFLVPLVYWFIEMTTKGKYTGILHLFLRTSNANACTEFFEGCSDVTPSLNWVVSKILLAGLCVVLVAFSIWLFEKSGRRFKLSRIFFR
jgi:hypothetical protein